VELLSYVFDHVAGKSVKGFNLLTLGWTDGFSFIPVAFNMLSSAKASKRLNNINESIDKRTVGYRNRKTAIMRKPDAAIAMIREALDAGIFADYVLMDTWFTNEPFIKRLRDEGLDVIGMLKDNRQLYHYRNKLMNLRTLAAHHVRMVGDNNLLGSVVVRTHKCSIPVKLVFVRNRNKRNEYIIILSTDCALSDEEIVRRYSARWSIECCFKVCKSMLKLGKEFQPVNYDTTVSSTALVFTRFIILEWIRRKNSDYRTMGDLFFLIYEEVRDLELSDALEKLVSILAVGIAQGRIQVDEVIRAELLDWYISQPIFIQSLCQSQLFKGSLW
jgi:hypothetical protein